MSDDLARRVTAASASALWQPVGSTTTDTGRGLLVQYPAWAYTRLALARFDPGGDRVADAVSRVLAIAQDLDGLEDDELTWEVVLGSPLELDEALRDVGGRLADTVDVLALDLLGDLPDPGPVDPRVRAGWVADVEQARGFTEVSVAGFGGEPSSDDRLAEIAASSREQVAAGTGGRAIATIDGRVVASGGLSIEGAVARLWGAASLPEVRGSGAYRAVLDERLRFARDHGAELALVKGRVDTSAPILHRYGFAGFGQERTYQVPLAVGP